MEGFWSSRFGKVIREEMPPRLSRVEVKGSTCHQEQHTGQFYW